jgi:hypothetical protein
MEAQKNVAPAYGGNYNWLVNLKRRYDPNNISS